jgi:hypothetical protein
MPAWLPPLAAAILAVAILNAAWLAQRLRGRPDNWQGRFLKELRRWDGRLPDELRAVRPSAAKRKAGDP